MRLPSNAPWPSGCGERSPSCRSGAAWRSCCSTWKATHTPRSPGSWASPRGPCARRCSTRAAGCASCWRTGRRTDDAGTAAVRSPARSGAGRRLAAGARAGGGGRRGGPRRVRHASAGPSRRPAPHCLVGRGAGPLGAGGRRRGGARLARGGVPRRTRHGGLRAAVGRGGADRTADAGGRSGPGLRAGQLERKLRDVEPFYRVGDAAARRDLRRGNRGRRGRPGPLGPRSLRRRARARPRRRPADGRIERRAGLDAAAARLRPRHSAAPLDSHDCGVGYGSPALRLDARCDGLGGRGAALPGPAGEVPRPYGPASASEGEDRFGWEEAMRDARQHAVAVVAALALGASLPAALAAQQLEVTLAEAVRRALQVQPAMVQSLGDARNAGASGRSAWGAFLPTMSTSASASRSNQDRFDPNSTLRLPPGYSYSGGLSASVQLFDGFQRFANLRATSATEDAASAGLTNQRYQTTLATQQAFFTALADGELVRVAEAQLQRAKEELQIAVNKFQAGAATRSDTLTATVDLGNARLALLQAQANLATSQANLARQIGADQPVRAVPDSQLPPVPDTTELRTAALRQAPVVMQAAASERATAATLWSNRSQYLPRLTASFNTSSQGLNEPWQGFDGGNRNLNRLSFALSWTVFDGFLRERTDAQSSVDLDNARAQTADVRRQLGADLTQQLAAMSTAFAKIEITGANVVAAAEARRVTQERYRLGAGTLLDLLTAQANQTQAEVNQVQARYDYLIARAQVEALVGHPL